MNPPDSLSSKTILITGSTDGLGKLVADHLAAQGATVLLHGRNREKGRAVLDELRRKTKSAKLTYYNGDFSSLQEVKALSNEILKSEKHIDVLINNVGIGRGKDTNRREVSKDGHELRFAVNYLAHVLLTEKLLPLLPPASARIINVASVGQETIDFSNLMLEKKYEGFFAYRQSKTALIMYTFDLAERLMEKGIAVNALHPASLMNTKMVLDEWDYTLTTVEQGAEAVESLLSVATTGEYYDGRRKAKAIAQAYDRKARETLRDLTREILAPYL